MTKAELIDRIVRSKDCPAGITKKCVGELLDLTFAELRAYFVQSKLTRKQPPRFTYPGFGTFTKKRRRSRKGVHPQTLEAMTIEGFETLDFKPSAELRRCLNPEKAERGGSKNKGEAAVSNEPSGLSGRRLLSRAEVDAEQEMALSLPQAELQSTTPQTKVARRNYK